MPASSFAESPAPGLVARPRFIKSRTIEKAPPRHGEKPYDQLVVDTFDGQPQIKMSQRLKLLEEADERKIRRGDAIDFIDSVRRKNQTKHRVPVPGRAKTFALHFAAFVAVYAGVAAAWCLIVRS